jgi:uncharacterized LabA/DUF88 family protein
MAVQIMARVIAYVDGYNLYYGLKSKGWKWAYWLNIQALVQLFLKPTQKLFSIKYFTTIVEYPSGRHKRQAVFLDVLKTLPAFEIHYGHFLPDTVKCQNCGHTYRTHHEKMTDVNIAVELMTDAFQDRFDTALLVSADSDLVGPVKAVKRLFPAKRVVAIFPPGRISNELKRVTDGFTHIGPDKLSKALFPPEVMGMDGFVLRRPEKWH